MSLLVGKKEVKRHIYGSWLVNFDPFCWNVFVFQSLLVVAILMVINREKCNRFV